MIYPEHISRILNDLRRVSRNSGNCVGSDANFSCGCVVRIAINVDPNERIVREAGFTTNGCGWMTASAEVICEFLTGKALADLHGLANDEMLAALGIVATRRQSCVTASTSAATAAFADLRSRQIEEFRGENALICTCFGVTEERIEAAITKDHLRSVDDIGAETNAGTGCGSCRMLIQEMIDA